MTDVNKQTPYRDRKRRRMRMTKLTAVALTAQGANPHADVTFFKSKKDGDDNTLEKLGDFLDVLTSSVEGHQHGIQVRDGEDGIYMYVGYARGEDEDSGHDHVVVMDANGNFVLSENDGHTHEIDTNQIRQILFQRMNKTLDYFEKHGTSDEVENRLSTSSIIKNIGETLMTTEEKLAKAQEETATLRKQLAVAVALGGMTDAQKAHYQLLGEAGQQAFVAKSAHERNADIEEALKSDPVVYTAEDGQEFRKSDDPRLVASVKSNDALAKRLDAEMNKNAEELLNKRAETELSNLPGDVATRAAILKSVDAIEDEAVRTEALKTLAAANTANKKAFKTSGFTKGAPDADNSAEDQLDNLAKKHAADNNVSFAKAYEAILSTPEGDALYNESLQG